MNEYQLNERQKVELREILNRKAECVCRKFEIPLRLTGQRKPVNDDFAEFWCRTGRSRRLEHSIKPHVSFAGILQFTLYAATPESHQRLDGIARRIAEAFSERRWITDAAFITTDLMGTVWLPRSDGRDRIAVVDGGFDFNVALSEAWS